MYIKGEGFELFVKEGQKVKMGDKFIRFDRNVIKKGYDDVCIVLLSMQPGYDPMQSLKNITFHEEADEA